MKRMHITTKRPSIARLVSDDGGWLIAMAAIAAIAIGGSIFRKTRI